MDSAELLTERLDRARRAVAEGETQIERQRVLIARLEQAGQDISEVRTLLDTLAKRQAERIHNLTAVMREYPA
jgi:hypothetical protein